MAEFVESESNQELFGETEFQLRDMLMALGASLVDIALEDRKKMDTKDPALPAGVAMNPRSSLVIGQRQ